MWCLYECGERKTIARHLTANNKHPKISCPGEGLARSFLGLNTISTNKIPRFCPFAPSHTRSSAQRPPFDSSSALQDPPRHGLPVAPLPHHFSAPSHSLSQTCLSQTLSRTCFSLRHCSCQVHLHVLVSEYIPSVLIHLPIIAIRDPRSLGIIAMLVPVISPFEWSCVHCATFRSSKLLSTICVIYLSKLSRELLA